MEETGATSITAEGRRNKSRPRGAGPPAALVGLTALLSLSLVSPAVSGWAAAGEPPIALNLERVELADDGREIERGLMYRRELCERCGMLFVYSGPRPLAFWMKNTFIPLDMIFMDKGGQIMTIHENTEPRREYPTYRSEAPCRYVLEVNAGFARREGLSPGQRVDLKALRALLVDYSWE